ncbi:Methionine synthase reductase [Strongyloides ratti]|uniref:Methionine synthase reductase n=1 Tax=Strongyloides ratti TaxID=34506 RepID=A0A090LLD7_STRRB|nr:Methionine synthase reductase [Strongyloides ratti]CEF68988.1 Methionine synthase reductase [Strongyloides ratti]
MISKDFLIIYGSQTGQAEAIAKQIGDRFIRNGFKPRVYCMSQSEKEFFIEKESFIVAVISSTGDGDPPEKSARFIRRISRKSLPVNWLCNLNYALLGLGDSNYSSFHFIPKKLDKILKNHGAKNIVEIGLADDQIGLELTVEPWIDNLFTKLNSDKDTIINQMAEVILDNNLTENITLQRGSENLRNEKNLRVPQPAIEYLASSVTHEQITDFTSIPWQNDSKFPGQGSPFYEADVVGVILITGNDINGVKEKREIQLEIKTGFDDLLKYEPGDSFYFITPNDKNEVENLLSKLNLLTIADQQLKLFIQPGTKKTNPTIPDYLPNNSTLRYIFTYCLDIRRTPGRPILRILADDCTDDDERRRLLELCSVQGMSEFNNLIRSTGVTLTDVLVAFPSCEPNVDRLLELLPRLIPRPYTVSCHHSLWKNRLRFVYSLMEFPAENGRQEIRTGLATGFIKSLNVGDKLMICLKETSKFRLPPISINNETDGYDIPLLMIGPGTGVAPFISFLQKIQTLKLKKNDNNFCNVPRYLFYGCRDLKKEFLYENEIKIFEQLGVLTKVFTCESRPQSEINSPIKHVQDLLKHNKDVVINFLKIPNSKIYLCGDGIGMSKDVYQCFLEIIKETYNVDNNEGITILNELKKNERYIEDVWS